MSNKILDVEQLRLANEVLSDIRAKIEHLAAGDRLLLFAYRRKLYKELMHDERGKPMARRKLKAQMWGLQQRKCAHCHEEMPLEYSELDRKFAPDGYTMENTELVHAKCHQERQAAKKYS